MSWKILQEIRQQDEIGHWHERIELSADTFASRERRHVTGRLFDYWRGLGAEPQAEAFVPEQRFDAADLAFCGRVDCQGSNPFDFVMGRHTRVSPSAWSTALEGLRLGDFPDPLHAGTLAQDYLSCTVRRVPIFQEIRHLLAGIERHYARLMVPLFDAEGNVTAVGYATRRFVTPDYPN